MNTLPTFLQNRIQSTSVVGKTSFIRMLIYGRSGVGKTMLVRTCPKPLILSIEKGLLVLEKDDIPVIELKTSVEELTVANVAKKFELFNTDLNAILDGLSKNTLFETIFVDSITEIADYYLNLALPISKDSRQAYLEAQRNTLAFIERLKQIDAHLVLIAREDTIISGTENAKTFYYTYDFPGRRLGVICPYKVDEVFRLEVELKGVDVQKRQLTTRFLQTRPSTNADAKDRSNKLSPYEKPDISAIIQKIKA